MRILVVETVTTQFQQHAYTGLGDGLLLLALADAGLRGIQLGLVALGGLGAALLEVRTQAGRKVAVVVGGLAATGLGLAGGGHENSFRTKLVVDGRTDAS